MYIYSRKKPDEIGNKFFFHSKKIPGIFVFLLLLVSVVFAFEYSFSVVGVDNLAERVYSEDVSAFRVKSVDSGFTFPDTPYQKVVLKEVSGEKANIKIVTGKGGQAAAPGKGDFLAATRYLDYDDPDIMALKKKFVRSTDKAGDIERYVNKRINNKKMGIPLVPASQIYKNRTGDCTEHAVLSVAILRSMGIPARAVVGMVLSRGFGGYKNVFVYHMWAEAFVNGRWVLIDATVPGRKYPNRYIAFAYHHLKTEMPLAYLKAVSAMKNFSVEYAE